MRKEVSTISVFSMAITFIAAVVLCMQITQVKLPTEWHLAGLTLWGIEVGLFGLVVLAWRRTAALSGWIVGILALVLVRLALTAASAYGLAGLRGGAAYALAMPKVADFLPRFAAALFSAIVFYPLRALLPERLGFGRHRHANPSGRANGIMMGSSSVWVMQEEGRPRTPREEEAPAAIVTIATPDQLRGTIDVPLSVVLAHVPQHYLAKTTSSYGDSFLVSIPVSLIVPQLKEAQIALSLDELRKLLPPGLLAKADAIGLEGEPTLVFLALEEIIPLLPDDVLELPPPSPPAWAELPDPETVVFATT